MIRLRAEFRHVFWSLLDTASYPVIYLAATPFLIKYMGTVVFGFWMVLNTLVVVLQLFNFNLGYTAMRHISHERAAGASPVVTDIINSLLKITLAQYTGVAILGGLLYFIMANTGWPGGQSLHVQHAGPCFLLAALLGGLKYFEQVFQNIIKSYEQFRQAAILNMIFRIGSLAVTLIIARSFPGMIVYVLLGNIAFSLCYLSLHYAYLHRALPFYRIGPPGHAGLQQRLLQYSMWPWLQSIIIVLTFQADRFWVSAYAGLSVVSAYALVATMFNHIHMIFMAMIAWISPRIIGMYARDEDPQAMYRYVRSLLMVISIFSLLLFYLLSPFLFRIWLGSETYGRLKDYIQAFTCFELAFVHTIMPVFYLNGTGRERQATYVTLLCCISCYVLMLCGLWTFGSPVAFIHGMTIGACLAVPVFNHIASGATHRKAAWQQLPEMIPVIAAIGIIYAPSMLLIIVLSCAGGWALWRYYLLFLTNRHVWRQVLSTGKGKA
jgi:O-antigen/teichoic acid export membrane protein